MTKVFDFSSPLEKTFSGSIAAIGNFDAVHRGHRSLLEVGRKRALQLGVPFSVLTFEPHPRSVFAKGPIENFRVTPDQVKFELLNRFGADIIFALPFTRDVAQLSAQQFITDVLKEHLNLNGIVCGYDFHFGHNRTGHAEDLEHAGLDVIRLGALEDSVGKVYSASRIRELLTAGDIEAANALLGWSWFVRSHIEHGDKRGRTIGFPTLNMNFGETIIPRHGVYASYVRHNGKIHKAISNIGIRPMFKLQKPMIETYVFDFAGDIYGDMVDVFPVQHIRDEMKLESLDTLKSQIEQDCIKAQSILSQHKGIY